MAWVMRNLFIEGAATDDDVLAALRPLIADRRGPAPLTLSPPLRGWRVVCGGGGWIDELPAAAKSLAQALGARVLSCELIAHSYLLRIGEHHPDGGEKLLQSPDLPWGAAEPHRGEMPLYEDVEQRTLTTLIAMGVPYDLLLVGVPALGAQSERDLGSGTQLCRTDDDALETRRCAVSIPVLPDPTLAPVVPRERDAGFGLSLCDERYVEGRPSARAVERLIAVEEAMLARARTCVPQTEIHLALTYHAGSYQHELDEMLRARERFVPPSPRSPAPPWWQFWRYFGFSGRR